MIVFTLVFTGTPILMAAEIAKNKRVQKNQVQKYSNVWIMPIPSFIVLLHESVGKEENVCFCLLSFCESIMF